MKDLLLSLTATTFKDMPAGQEIRGCNSCLTVWSGDESCFVCGEESFVIAKPINTSTISVTAPKNSLMLNGTHYIDDKRVIELIKQALNYI